MTQTQEEIVFLAQHGQPVVEILDARVRVQRAEPDEEASS